MNIVYVVVSDQLLNALLRGAKVVLQLSISEGFEIKVTEALHKGKPVIVYNTGGLTLQIKDNVDGFIVKVGDIDTVAKLLLELTENTHRYMELVDAAKKTSRNHYFTPENAKHWLEIMLNESNHYADNSNPDTN